MRIPTLLALALTACANDGAGDDAELDALLADLEAAVVGYEAWDQVAEHAGVAESNSPHGAYTQVWLNDVAFATVEAAGGGDMPDGAVLHKEAYTDDAGTDLVSSTAMLKDPDYGWFFATWNADGTVRADMGQPAGCVACHQGGQDWVLVTTW